MGGRREKQLVVGHQRALHAELAVETGRMALEAARAAMPAWQDAVRRYLLL